MSPLNYIENKLELHPTRTYGAIIGLHPSKGARSPILWRKVFTTLKIESDFHAFDVTKKSLPKLVEALKKDTRFIGGAVAVPHKESLLALIDIIDRDAELIGAVNALRRTPEGKIAGANTDGLAAIQALARVAGKLEGRSVALLGLGGAGKAVATNVALAGAKLSIWNRTVSKAVEFAKNYELVKVAHSPEAAIKNASILINCTSVGFEPSGNEIKICPLHLKELKALPSNAVVFDIIYQPLKTSLLKAAEEQNLLTLNGLEMNLGQAAIAFNLAYPQTSFYDVFKIMEGA